MKQVQAVVLSCIDHRLRKALENFIENELSLYAVAEKFDNGGVKKIFEEGPIREWIFENFKSVFDNHNANRVILINHQDCDCYGGSKAFKSYEEELRTHEVELRHAVSAVRARFPDKTIEAYFATIDSNNNVGFEKVV